MKRVRRVQFERNIPTRNGASLRTVFEFDEKSSVGGWTVTETPNGLLLSGHGEELEVRGVPCFVWWEDVPEEGTPKAKRGK